MDFSFAVFGPQGAAPSVSYLQTIRAYIIKHPILKCIHEEISTLQSVLDIVTEKNENIAALPQAKEYMGFFTQWIINDDAGALRPSHHR
jgi:hypothetical protein